MRVAHSAAFVPLIVCLALHTLPSELRAHQRAPVPDAQSQDTARKAAGEIYGGRFRQVKTTAEKTALATEMIDAAAKVQDGSADQYVLLKIASDIASGAGDAPTALQAVEKLSERFDVPAAELIAETLLTAARNATTSSQQKTLGEAVLSMADAIADDEEFELVLSLCEAARSAAQKSRQYALAKELTAKIEDLKQRQSAFEENRKAWAVLDNNPTEPAANLAAGRYLCFVKGDWDRGVAMLALGSDAALKDVAIKDLRGATAPEEQAAIGDGWWDLAESKQSTSQEYRDAWAVLEKDPTNPAANLAAGRYLCLVKGDWDRGVPMLALGSDATLKDVAVKDLRGANSAVEQAAIGNAWWDVAETKQGSERDMLRLRAGFWYRQAEPNLAGGLEGLKIKQRLADLEKLHREAAAQPPAPALAPFDERTAKQHQTLWARHLNVPVVQTNSISMKLVLIPPGEFDMGSTEEEIGRLLLEAKLQKAPGRYAQHVRDEGPRHHVRITKPFCLGVCEVTQTQYQTVLGSNPSKFRGDPSRPVEQVTWHEAVDFCRRLSELPQEKAAGAVYRLPTEAEWEHACRAGTTTRYSFGDAPQPLSAHACWAANAQGQTAPVGRLRPNAWGLLDMHGNVWEWCSDRHGGDYYATSPRDDPTGPEAGPTRVLRGGAWDAAYPGHFRCAYRPYAQPDARASGYGFRVARTVVLDTFPTASVKGQRS